MARLWQSNPGCDEPGYSFFIICLLKQGVHITTTCCVAKVHPPTWLPESVLHHLFLKVLKIPANIWVYWQFLPSPTVWGRQPAANSVKPNQHLVTRVPSDLVCVSPFPPPPGAKWQQQGAKEREILGVLLRTNEVAHYYSNFINKVVTATVRPIRGAAVSSELFRWTTHSKLFVQSASVRRINSAVSWCFLTEAQEGSLVRSGLCQHFSPVSQNNTRLQQLKSCKEVWEIFDSILPFFGVAVLNVTIMFVLWNQRALQLPIQHH